MMRVGKSQGTLNWQTNEAYLLTSRKPKSFENIESRILNTQFIEVPCDSDNSKQIQPHFKKGWWVGEKPVCTVCGISTHQRVIFEHADQALDEIRCQKCGTTYQW